MNRYEVVDVLEKMCRSFISCTMMCPMYTMNSETCSFSELSDRDLEFVVEAVMESSLDDVKSRLMETCELQWSRKRTQKNNYSHM